MLEPLAFPCGPLGVPGSVVNSIVLYYATFAQANTLRIFITKVYFFVLLYCLD